ncbi:MAG TPA: sulfite oxidase [Vicinamibacterales bacterium]|nr:sulfite oxidase [Vicinamibacterales bacterium]
MALFVVRHQHSPERCPAQDAETGASLLNYLSRPSVRQHGVRIQGEAVVKGEHTLFLIAEADDERGLREFMQPFQQAGRVDIFPASTCAGVVASGGCGLDMPVSERPTLNPAEACQDAIDAGLVVHRAHPLNCETSIPALIGSVVMPNAHFYVRNHFQIPMFEASTYRLVVGGLVDRPLSLSLNDIRQMPSQTIVATLECAGNGRTLFEPPIAGEKWNMGAVSTAEWSGVPLVEVLDRAGVRSGARDVLFKGADFGTVDGHAESIRFERSLPVDASRDAGALLAYAMNGEALPVQHGYPLRVIVPSWYAVASVKWLTEIELIDRPFAGHYQVEKYQYEWERGGDVSREPVTLQRVRALITEPAPDQKVPCGDLVVRGVAWSGAAQIARVDVSVNGGPWQEARLVSDRSRHSWQWWEATAHIATPSAVTLRARATDLAGRTQPDRAEWNRLGYGNNSIQEISIHAVWGRRSA